MRSFVVIMIVCIMILLAFSEVWLPKLTGRDHGVFEASTTTSTTPASR